MLNLWSVFFVWIDEADELAKQFRECFLILSWIKKNTNNCKMLFRMIYCSCKKDIHIIVYIEGDMLSVGGEKLIAGRLKNKDIVHKNWGRALVCAF